MVFISNIVYSSKVNPVSMQQLNGLLFDECRRNGFKFVDNGAVSEIDLWADDIHMTESGKRIIGNNFLIVQRQQLLFAKYWHIVDILLTYY